MTVIHMTKRHERPSADLGRIDLNAIANNVRELPPPHPFPGQTHGGRQAKRLRPRGRRGGPHRSGKRRRVAGVAALPEAIALREAGLAAPILVFGYTPPATQLG